MYIYTIYIYVHSMCIIVYIYIHTCIHTYYVCTQASWSEGFINIHGNGKSITPRWFTYLELGISFIRFISIAVLCSIHIMYWSLDGQPLIFGGSNSNMCLQNLSFCWTMIEFLLGSSPPSQPQLEPRSELNSSKTRSFRSASICGGPHQIEIRTALRWATGKTLAFFSWLFPLMESKFFNKNDGCWDSGVSHHITSFLRAILGNIGRYELQQRSTLLNQQLSGHPTFWSQKWAHNPPTNPPKTSGPNSHVQSEPLLGTPRPPPWGHRSLFWPLQATPARAWRGGWHGAWAHWNMFS